MKKAERYKAVLSYLGQQMPDVDTELQFADTFQLLVAVILSAQCTDKRVNMVTPPLFQRFPDATAMAQAEADEVYEYIKSVSYPNAKARHLTDMARKLMSDFAGRVPDDRERLQSLPGVGRKTANVVLAVAFGRSTLAVDTHVYRVSHRLGLVSTADNTPYKVEMTLAKYIPDQLKPKAHHWLLLHGRYVCTAQRPKCRQCGLREVCPTYLKSFSKNS